MEVGRRRWLNSLFAIPYSLLAFHSLLATYEEEGYPFFAGLATTYSPMS
jgi:hypothetical protein